MDNAGTAGRSAPPTGRLIDVDETLRARLETHLHLLVARTAAGPVRLGVM